MKLKEHGYFLVNFVTEFAEGKMSRFDFDLDYSGYCIEHFPHFKAEHPRLSARFADTIDRTYDACLWMDDKRFQAAIASALHDFFTRMWIYFEKNLPGNTPGKFLLATADSFDAYLHSSGRY